MSMTEEQITEFITTAIRDVVDIDAASERRIVSNIKGVWMDDRSDEYFRGTEVGAENESIRAMMSQHD